MTYRGLLKGLLEGFDFEWSWDIQLLEVDVVSVSVLLRGRDDLSALRKVFTDHLRAQRKKHEGFSKRHFVYFVARRPKVRFASIAPARLRGDRLELRIVVGDRWLARKVSAALAFRVVDGEVLAPLSVEVSGDRMSFHYVGGLTATSTLFDYLLAADVDLDLSTTIEYVGMTANPEDRPTNLEHRGLFETVHGTNSDVEDVVIMFNTFHVRISTATPVLTVQTSNSLTDQLDIRAESEFIEKILIDHFEPAQQSCSLTKERAMLRRFESELQARGVRTVELAYEVDASCDVYKIGSAHVPASRAHRLRRSLASSAIDDPRRSSSS